MASISETGHAQNVANLETLISSFTAFGTSYNPSNNSITLTALQSLLSDAKKSLSDVNIAFSTYTIATTDRSNAFKPFSKLVTRVNNALKASDTNKRLDESAQAIVRKLQGTRASAKLTDVEKASLEAQGKSTTQISTSQMSFDNKLENFDKLIALLASVPNYNPNEVDLKIDTLKALYADLKAKNAAVASAEVTLSNARIARNALMYTPNSGLVDRALNAKMYVKSVFGTSSPYFKQISKLPFKSYKF